MMAASLNDIMDPYYTSISVNPLVTVKVHRRGEGATYSKVFSKTPREEVSRLVLVFSNSHLDTAARYFEETGVYSRPVLDRRWE